MEKKSCINPVQSRFWLHFTTKLLFLITSHFSCKESKSFEMELETGGNTLEPFFHNSWTGNRVVARVTLHTRKEPGIMQQTILCCLHRTWIEPSTLDNGRIRPSTSSLENFSHEIVNRNTFPRHFRIFMLLVLSPPNVSYMYLWRLGIGTRLNMAADRQTGSPRNFIPFQRFRSILQ